MARKRKEKVSQRQSQKQTVIVKIGREDKSKRRTRRRRVPKRSGVEQPPSMPTPMPVVAYQTGYGNFPMIQGPVAPPVAQPQVTEPFLFKAPAEIKKPVMEDVGVGSHGFVEIVDSKEEIQPKQFVRPKQYIPPETAPIPIPVDERIELPKEVGILPSVGLEAERPFIPPAKIANPEPIPIPSIMPVSVKVDSDEVNLGVTRIPQKVTRIAKNPEQIARAKERTKLMKEFRKYFPNEKTNKLSNEQLLERLSSVLETTSVISALTAPSVSAKSVSAKSVSAKSAVAQSAVAQSAVAQSLATTVEAQSEIFTPIKKVAKPRINVKPSPQKSIMEEMKERYGVKSR